MFIPFPFIKQQSASQWDADVVESLLRGYYRKIEPPPWLSLSLPLPPIELSGKFSLLLSKGTSTAVNSWPNCSNGIPKLPCSRPEKSQPFGPLASNSWYLVKLLPPPLQAPSCFPPTPSSCPLALTLCSLLTPVWSSLITCQLVLIFASQSPGWMEGKD